MNSTIVFWTVCSATALDVVVSMSAVWLAIHWSFAVFQSERNLIARYFWSLAGHSLVATGRFAFCSYLYRFIVLPDRSLRWVEILPNLAGVLAGVFLFILIIETWNHLRAI